VTDDIEFLIVLSRTILQLLSLSGSAILILLIGAIAVRLMSESRP
jgi:hypothetical protein